MFLKTSHSTRTYFLFFAPENAFVLEGHESSHPPPRKTNDPLIPFAAHTVNQTHTGGMHSAIGDSMGRNTDDDGLGGSSTAGVCRAHIWAKKCR